MAISWDNGIDGAPGAMAAWPRARAAMAGRVIRAGRCRARRRVIAVIVAGSLGLLAGLGAAAPASGSVSGGSIAQPAPGAQLWVNTFDGESAVASAVAASPDGGTVFVTGERTGANFQAELATVAYDAATGAQRWLSLYPGFGFAVAVSPDGRTVFVTGTNDYTTIAYDAATGAQLWVKHYVGRAPRSGTPHAVVVSPDSNTVYVTGTSNGDYVTIAYNAATGARRWLSRYHAPGFGDVARAIAISRDGRAVYVTGRSAALGYVDAATVAYNAATGAQLWARRYNGRANDYDAANSVAVAPGGRTVYITGGSRGKTSRFDL